MQKCIYCTFDHFLMCGASPGTAASKAERSNSKGDEEGWEGAAALFRPVRMCILTWQEASLSMAPGTKSKRI